jgi:pyrroline-5-carboxylate reductase
MHGSLYDGGYQDQAEEKECTMSIITIIGSGVMGEAILAGIIRAGVAAPEQIRASGPRKERGIQLQEQFGVGTYTDNVEAVNGADVIILSVKPQRIDKVMSGLRGKLSPTALVLSIVAGASLARLMDGLNHGNVVRAMPNTPAQIGEGITVWTTSPDLPEHQKTLAAEILKSLGAEIYVEDEGYLDMATAVSGTGPAYVFLFMEAMIDAGVHLGFPRRIAEELVVKTLRGSVDYYTHNQSHVAALRNQVTSPGGTSAEALYYLEKAGFRTAISRAVWAAYERSQALGKDDASSSQGTHKNE